MRGRVIEPKSGSCPVAGKASGRLKGRSVGVILSLTRRSSTAHRSVVMNCSAVTLTSCKAARILAICDLRMFALPCMGVRYNVVCPAWVAPLSTAASSSGQLVPGCTMTPFLDPLTESALRFCQ